MIAVEAVRDQAIAERDEAYSEIRRFGGQWEELQRQYSQTNKDLEGVRSALNSAVDDCPEELENFKAEISRLNEEFGKMVENYEKALEEKTRSEQAAVEDARPAKEYTTKER